MVDTEYLDGFEQRLQEELVRLCTSCRMLEGQALLTDDIEQRWKELAPEYMADAVPQIQDYPTVSVAWAAYIGMGVAEGWDKDWAKYSNAPYQSFYGSQGFDDMDEHIVTEIMGLLPDSDEARMIEEMIRRCGETAVTAIRHEQIDPQTPMAFHVFARTCKVMFRIGASMELKRLGYRFERVYLS